MVACEFGQLQEGASATTTHHPHPISTLFIIILFIIENTAHIPLKMSGTFLEKVVMGIMHDFCYGLEKRER